MSIFDDAFDANRKLSRSGCGCGQHRSVEEHDRTALTPRCDAPPNDEARCEGVVASAVIPQYFRRTPRAGLF
jgi:nitrate/nitrite transport system substrate-binding protein